MSLIREAMDRAEKYRFDWKGAGVELPESKLPARAAFRCEYDPNYIVVVDFDPAELTDEKHLTVKENLEGVVAFSKWQLAARVDGQIDAQEVPPMEYSWAINPTFCPINNAKLLEVSYTPRTINSGVFDFSLDCKEFLS